jgi:haloalkane dehalogenase
MAGDTPGGVLRTPDERFRELPGYPFEPRYVTVDGLRMHYVDEGPRDAAPVLMLHGEPSWSYLYRTMIPLIATAGFRAIAPDLVGFGRSDKPAEVCAYSYAAHVEWMRGFVQALGLREVTLVCQDWGSLIGLRVAAENPEWFARIVAANAALPVGDGKTPFAFRAWQAWARWTPWLPAGRIVQAGSHRRMPREVRAAYDAPFPSDRYKAGARAFPPLVPTKPADPARAATLRAWEVLERWEKPFLTAYGQHERITRSFERQFQRRIPGARGQPHATISGAGHFLQEDAGEELARVVVDFIGRTGSFISRVFHRAVGDHGE